MATITVDGRPYKVLETLGYQPSLGLYGKAVHTTDHGERIAISTSPRGPWRWACDVASVDLPDTSRGSDAGLRTGEMCCSSTGRAPGC